MPIDFDALLAPTWVPVRMRGEEFEVGCIPLAPADFDEHGRILFGLLAGAAIAPDETRKSTREDNQNADIITCLTVRSVRYLGDEESTPVRFVLDQGSEGTEYNPPRIWVGRLQDGSVGRIAETAMVPYMEAAVRVARFRLGAETTTQSGRDGEEVRPDAGPVAGEE